MTKSIGEEEIVKEISQQPGDSPHTEETPEEDRLAEEIEFQTNKIVSK